MISRTLAFLSCGAVICSAEKPLRDVVESSDLVSISTNQNWRDVAGENEITKKFIDWLVSSNRASNIMALRLDDEQNIVEVLWNICGYGDLELVRQLSGLDSLKSCEIFVLGGLFNCLLYTSPSPRDQRGSRMPSSA